MQDIQFDVLTDRPRHCDFRRIDLTKPIEVEVEVTLLGIAPGIAKGGTLVKDHAHVTVRCLPTEIPDAIEVSVATLDLDMSLTAADVPLPKGVELVVDRDTVICHVAKLVAQAAAAPAAVVEAAPAADAAPAAGAAKKDEKKPDDKKK